MMIKNFKIIFSVLIINILFFALNAFAIDSDSSADQIEARENIERQEQQLNAEILVKKANQNFQDADYEVAKDQYLEAIKILSQISPPDSLTKDKIQKTKDLLATSYTYWAEEILNEANTKANTGELSEAIELCNKAAEINPKVKKNSDKIIKKLKLKIKQKNYQEITSESTFNPNYKKKVYNVDVLYEQAKKLYLNKKYTKAKDKLEELLVLDPYNSKAIYYLKLVNKKIYYAGEEREAVISNERFAQTQWESLTPILTKTMTGNRIDFAGTTPILKHQKDNLITKKLEEIIIPHIAFEDVPIETAMMYLKRESKKLDPEGKGINIFLKINKTSSSIDEDLGGDDEIWEEEIAEEKSPSKEENDDMPEESFAEQFLITIVLDNVTLGKAIEYICAAAGLKHTVGEYAVEVFSQDIESSMEIAVYPVPREFFISEDPTVRALTNNYTIDLKTYFEDHGVKFSEEATAVYDTKVSRLIVKNYPDEIKKVSTLIEKLSYASPGVSIASKFVEIRQQDFEELGFEWRTSKSQDGKATSWTNNNQINTFALKDNSTAADATYDRALGISYNGPDGFSVSAVIHALDQNEKVNLLSAPKVTTISGQKAVIKMTTDSYYPIEWEAPTLTENDNGLAASDIYIPPTPKFGGATQNGIVFTVTPYVASDHYTIDLELKPEIQRFVGWTNYTYEITDSQNNKYYPNLKMPKIKVNTVITQMKVYDGETVVLGGVLKDDTDTVDDRIPIIGDVPLFGRLFRSQIEEGDKTNLLIFTKVMLIKPDGTPLRPQIDNSLPTHRFK